MEQSSYLNLQDQPQSPQLNVCFLFFPRSFVSPLVCFTIIHMVLLKMIQDSWIIECNLLLYLISVLMLLCNGKIRDLLANRIVEVQKWRRLCSILLCLLVGVFPATIYHARMEYWLRVSISIGSVILLVLIVVLHITLVELPEVKENIVIQPKYTGLTMYYIINLIPFCATFTFVLMGVGDPWSLWCNMFLCTDLLFIAMCASKAFQLISVPNCQAEAMKWNRAVSFGMAMLPALELMYLDRLLWDSFTRNLSRICHGFLVFVVGVLHVVYVEMAKVKEETESEKRS